MAEPPVYLRVRDLHVEYELFEDRRAALRKRLVERSSTPARAVVHAVRGVSFEVRAGERLGIVGNNGSGKSTLLGAIAGLVPKSAGTIEVAEEPKLLGVGATMIADASGRRNARLGSLALGVPKRVLGRHVEEIIEFAALGEAIDRPLRTYSSGMRARLQFAIATSVRPKILLVDEALSVGDKSFREKSSQRIDELVNKAGVFVLVNHSLDELASLCDRCIWLEDGVVRADGSIDEVIARYEDA